MLGYPGEVGEAAAFGCVPAKSVRTGGGSRLTRGGRCISPDVVAPGVEVLAASGSDRLAATTGTSFAAAHVAGIAALLRQAVPSASADEVRAAIVQGAGKDLFADTGLAGDQDRFGGRSD